MPAECAIAGFWCLLKKSAEIEKNPGRFAQHEVEPQFHSGTRGILLHEQGAFPGLGRGSRVPRLLPLAWILAVVASVPCGAAPARFSVEPGRSITFFLDADATHYHLLQESRNLLQFRPYAMALGDDQPGLFVAPLVPGRTEDFFRLETIPLTSGRDTDGDGLPDIYELQRSGQLNPLNPADAGADPDGDGFTNLQDFQNRPPVLAAIGNRTLPLGSSLTLQLAGSDPDNQPLAFSVRPLPLPDGAHLYSATRQFVFRPVVAGPVSLVFAVSDGRLSDEETVSINVTPSAPGSATRLLGRLLDTTDYVAGITRPVVGATISLLDTATSTTTNANGDFTLSGIPSGSQVLDIDSKTAHPAPGGASYAGFRETMRWRMSECSFCTRRRAPRRGIL